MFVLVAVHPLGRISCLLLSQKVLPVTEILLYQIHDLFDFRELPLGHFVKVFDRLCQGFFSHLHSLFVLLHNIEQKHCVVQSQLQLRNTRGLQLNPVSLIIVLLGFGTHSEESFLAGDLGRVSQKIGR